MVNVAKVETVAEAGPCLLLTLDSVGTYDHHEASLLMAYMIVSCNNKFERVRVLRDDDTMIIDLASKSAAAVNAKLATWALPLRPWPYPYA
eukprot:6186294-Pleurochrysis_carterae.AAC.6